MKILLNGDSNMAGEELTDKSLSVASQLCKMLDGEEINISMSGASNDRIYNTTLDRVNSGAKFDFLVVGWSEVFRVQWYIIHDGRPEFIEFNNLGVGTGMSRCPPEYETRAEHWLESSKNHEYRVGLCHYWHERIYNLHCYLNYRKIPHLFFHAFYDFQIPQEKYQLDWHHRFLGPYQPHLSYTRWCALKGYQEITPGLFHYEPAAQKSFACLLYDHIQQHDLTRS